MLAQGKQYEERAARWLNSRHGMELLTRNYRCKSGEIDLVVRDGEYLVFVEVRLRSNLRYASAAASVDRAKQRRLLRSAQSFLLQHPGLAKLPIRFDVIAFQPPQSGAEPRIRWIPGAFTA